MARILPPFVPLFLGSSLTTGRLASDWVPRLDAELKDQPEAIGPYSIINAGKGSQNSAWGVTQIDLICATKPTHILMEGFAINDCIDFGSGPAISRADHITNITTMVTAFQARIPGIDITIQTMSPVSVAGAPSRPQLAAYYADEVALAATLGVHSLDNYTRWTTGLAADLGSPGGALPDWLSNTYDGLHPLYEAGVEVYLYPYVQLWARQKMAAMWGLTVPVTPILPAAYDCDVLMIASGGAGGDRGGGGGNGAVRRFRARLAELLGPVTGAGPGAGVSGNQGGSGGDCSIGGKTAKGGGGGGLYAAGASGLTSGKDGGSGGGAGPSTSLISRVGGISLFGHGNYGGASSPTANQSGGGGGGAVGFGADGTVNAGQGGPGWLSDVPGDAQTVGAGGPGGSVSGTQPGYQPGAGPTALGGGGKASMAAGAGDAGGPWAIYVWYPTGPVHTGGAITTSGGKTVHKFTASGAFG